MRCQARTRSGDQCRNNAISGASFCYISTHGCIQKTLGQRVGNFVQNKWLSLALIFVTFIGLPLTIISLLWQSRADRLAATSGVLSGPVHDGPLSVSVGSAEFIMLSRDGIVFDDKINPLLSLRIANGKLLVTTRIRDEKGNLIAEMTDNEWKLQQPPGIFDRNYTADVLEVRDRTGRVALQVANLGETVDLSAIFHCPNGWTYMAGTLGAVGSGVELRPPGQALTSEIPSICDYPSELHLGSCPGLERLKRVRSRPHTVYQLHFPVHLCL